MWTQSVLPFKPVPMTDQSRGKMEVDWTLQVFTPRVVTVDLTTSANELVDECGRGDVDAATESDLESDLDWEAIDELEEEYGWLSDEYEVTCSAAATESWHGSKAGPSREPDQIEEPSTEDLELECELGLGFSRASSGSKATGRHPASAGRLPVPSRQNNAEKRSPLSLATRRSFTRDEKLRVLTCSWEKPRDTLNFLTTTTWHAGRHAKTS